VGDSSLQLQEFDIVVAPGDIHMEEVAADFHQGLDGGL